MECVEGSVLIQNGCYEGCYDGYYLREGVTQDMGKVYDCLGCDGECEKCTAVDNCTACSYGYYLSLNTTSNTSQCRSTCPEGFYKNHILLTCDACKPPCKTCLNGLICLSCEDNLTLLNEECVKTCPETFFMEFDE